jgi:hypothetical protein
MVHSVFWPTSIGMILDFLSDLEAGGFGKTIPTAISCSLAYMEKIGGFPISQWITTTNLWRQSFSAMTLRAESSIMGKSVHKAPQLFLAIIIALELYVCSTRTTFKRAFAWTKLIKHWCALRYDDLLGLDLARLTPWHLLLERSPMQNQDHRSW